MRRCGFPLGKTGGLIEATGGASRVAGGCACFRWVKPAASLKQDEFGYNLFKLAGFPLGKTGGLIEARIEWLRLYHFVLFPLGKTGGLIEADDKHVAVLWIDG